VTACALTTATHVAPAPQKAELNTCAWLGDLDPDDEGQDTDTYLAVGSNDSLIHIISIARCRVICVLQGPSFPVITTEGNHRSSTDYSRCAAYAGHKGAVIDLAVHPQRSGCLLSVGADNTVRLWDCRNPYGEPEKSCLATFETSAIVAVPPSCSANASAPFVAHPTHATQTFSPEGTRFVTGGSGGALREWAIPGEYLDDEEEKVHTQSILQMRCTRPRPYAFSFSCPTDDRENDHRVQAAAQEASSGRGYVATTHHRPLRAQSANSLQSLDHNERRTDCVRAVGGHYVSKDIEGKIVVWQAMDSEVQFFL
jgi:WD40 repeat protein